MPSMTSVNLRCESIEWELDWSLKKSVRILGIEDYQMVHPIYAISV